MGPQYLQDTQMDYFPAAGEQGAGEETGLVEDGPQDSDTVRESPSVYQGTAPNRRDQRL